MFHLQNAPPNHRIRFCSSFLSNWLVIADWQAKVIKHISKAEKMAQRENEKQSTLFFNEAFQMNFILMNIVQWKWSRGEGAIDVQMRWIYGSNHLKLTPIYSYDEWFAAAFLLSLASAFTLHFDAKKKRHWNEIKRTDEKKQKIALIEWNSGIIENVQSKSIELDDALPMKTMTMTI